MTGGCLCGQVGLRVNEIELDGTSFFIGIMIIMDKVSHAPTQERLDTPNRTLWATRASAASDYD
jgi:hypothetical protein